MGVRIYPTHCLQPTVNKQKPGEIDGGLLVVCGRVLCLFVSLLLHETLQLRCEVPNRKANKVSGLLCLIDAGYLKYPKLIFGASESTTNCRFGKGDDDAVNPSETPATHGLAGIARILPLLFFKLGMDLDHIWAKPACWSVRAGWLCCLSKNSTGNTTCMLCLRRCASKQLVIPLTQKKTCGYM